MKLPRSRATIIGVCCALAGAAVVPVVGLAGISGSTGDGPMVLESGGATATYTEQVNIASIPTTNYKQNWMRVGDTVSATGVIPLTPSTTGPTGVYISLPVPTTSVSRYDCSGSAAVSAPVFAAARIYGSEAAGHTGQCIVDYVTSSNQLQYIHYNLSYRVKG
jgi:hypothetical protein